MRSKPMQFAVGVIMVAIGWLLSPLLAPVASAASEATLRVPNDLAAALLTFGFIAAAVAVGVIVASLLRR